MKTKQFSRRIGAFSSVVTSALLVAACGGSPPPAPAPIAAPPKPAPVADAVDLSAVTEPTDLVVTARLAKPSQDVAIVGGWTNLPMPNADDVADLVTDLDVGQILDLDAPIDVAVAVQGHGEHIRPIFAVAVGVKAGTAAGSLPHVKSTSLGGGIFKLQGRSIPKPDNGDSADDDDDDSSSKICEIIPSFGPSASRLVCGSSQGAVAELGPYLARTAPRATYSSDLHIEGRLDPLRSTIEQARLAIPILVNGVTQNVGGAAAHDLVNAVLGDLVDASLDLDRIKIDANLADPAATATITTSFRTANSLVAHMVVAHPERADVPPASFWHLPADSKGAFFARGVDSKDLDHPRELVVDAISKALDQRGLAAPDRAAIADVVQQSFAVLSSPSVFANGFDQPAAPAVAAVKKDDKKKPTPEDRAERRDERDDAMAHGAWALWGIESPIAKVASVGKSLVTTLHRPGVSKLLKNAMPEGVPAPTLVSSPVSAKLGLPKDTVHFTMTIVSAAPEDYSARNEMSAPVAVKGKAGKAPATPAKPPAKPKVKLEKPYVVSWYFVPDAGRTWIGYGADDTIVANHLKLALSTSADPATLQSRAGLDDLKNAKANSGGFLTTRGLLAPSPLEPVFHTRDRDMAHMFGRLANSPQKGETPMPMLIRSVAPAAQGAGSLEITAKVPRETVKDLVAAALGR